MDINFSWAFDQMLKDCGISAKWLAEKAEVSQQTISDFRRGKKGVSTETLRRLLKVLPLEAIMYFFNLLLGRSIPIEEMVPFMDGEQLSGVMFAIAKTLKSNREVNDRKNADAHKLLVNL